MICARILKGHSIIPPTYFTPHPNPRRRLHHSYPLVTPFARTASHQSSFFISCTRVWNSLPDQVVSAPSRFSFKKRLLLKPPQFFSEAVTDYILFAMVKLRVMVEDVPDADVRAKLVKVGYGQHFVYCFNNHAWYLLQFQNVSDEEGMRDLLDSDEFAFRFDIGVGQATHLLKLADKGKNIPPNSFTFCSDSRES